MDLVWCVMADQRLLIVAVALPIIVVGAFAFTLFSSYFYSSVEKLEEGIYVGYLAQDIEIRDLDGNFIRLGDYRGKVVVLEFSATWCGTCKAQLSVLKTLYDEYSGDDVVFITVDVDASEEMLRQYRDSNDIPWVVAGSQEAGVIYGVYSLPTIIIIDRDGVIRFRQSNYVDYSTLVKVLDELV